jgi:hypothetical protein
MKSSISVYTWFETGNEKKVVSSDIQEPVFKNFRRSTRPLGGGVPASLSTWVLFRARRRPTPHVFPALMIQNGDIF